MSSEIALLQLPGGRSRRRRSAGVELDADDEDQAVARAATVVTAAFAGSHLEQARWTYLARIAG